MVLEQWLQLKMNFLLDYNMKIVIKWGTLTFGGGEGGIEIWWGESTVGECFQVGQNKQIFGEWMGIQPVGKNPGCDFREENVYSPQPL